MAHSIIHWHTMAWCPISVSLPFISRPSMPAKVGVRHQAKAVGKAATCHTEDVAGESLPRPVAALARQAEY